MARNTKNERAFKQVSIEEAVRKHEEALNNWMENKLKLLNQNISSVVSGNTKSKLVEGRK